MSMAFANGAASWWLDPEELGLAGGAWLLPDL